MKKSELRQLIRQVIKEQFTRPEDELLKRKKKLRKDPRAKIPRPIDMAQPKSASSGCHPNARKVVLANCFNGITAMFGCATVGGQVPIVGQMIDADSFLGGTQLVPRQIISVEDANPAQLGNLDLILYPDQTATECGYDCLGEAGGYQCQFNGDGTAEFDTLQSCVSSCVPPVPGCMDQNAENYNPEADIEDNDLCEYSCTGPIMTGAIGLAFSVSDYSTEPYTLATEPTPVSFYPAQIPPNSLIGYCRFCLSGIGSNQHTANMTAPSPSPYFETNQDVCQFMENNGCCSPYLDAFGL